MFQIQNIRGSANLTAGSITFYTTATITNYTGTLSAVRSVSLYAGNGIIGSETIPVPVAIDAGGVINIGKDPPPSPMVVPTQLGFDAYIALPLI